MAFGPDARSDSVMRWQVDLANATANFRTNGNQAQYDAAIRSSYISHLQRLLVDARANNAAAVPDLLANLKPYGLA